jgi:tRNA (guanine10-N2)-dimethyltransferase
MKLLQLSKENIELARNEVYSVTSSRKFIVDQNLLMVDTKIDLSRLAYTHSVYKLLFFCKKEDLSERIRTYPFKRQYDKSFCVKKIGDVGLSGKELAGMVWHRLKKPKVDLEDAKSRFVFLATDGFVYCGKHEYDIDKGILTRKPHHRPKSMPISLDPRLARCMVNLSGPGSKRTIVDPFCGTGGILVEAALMGHRVFGYDIDHRMVQMTKENLNHYGLCKKKGNNACLVAEKDATEIGRIEGHVVTDLPYGKNTKSRDYDKIYERFLKKVVKRSVISFPDYDIKRYRKMIVKSGLEILYEFDYYIHRSMSKKVFVVVRV